MLPNEKWLCPRLPAVVCAAAALTIAAPAPAQTSQLWGDAGERFDPTGRLMEWCYAGYHAAEAPIPDLSPTVSVTDHGAVANDSSNDTAAFAAAIDAASGGGVVSVPAGRFIIRDKLTLTDGVVLQGAGRGVTILDIPLSLTDVYGNPGLDGGGTSTYSFGQAFIEVRGSYPNTVLADVTTNALRGDLQIEVSATDQLAVGQWIRIVQTDVGGDLMDRLHSDLMEAGPDTYGDRGMHFHTRVTAISGTTVSIDRHLPVDIDTAWSPEVLEFDPNRSEIGVEHLTIEFPLTSYPGHFDEQGYNAIDFFRAVNSWVRDVEILNGDYGVNVRNSFFVTVQDVILDTTGDRGSIVGHHGLNNGHGGDNLFVDFDIRTTFQHDLTNEWYATGIVFSRGRGDNLRMDHHCAAPYQTLWTELDTGLGTTPFVSGGRSDRCPHTASYDTLWNIRAAADMDLPADDYGPRMNFVGFQTAATTASSPYDWWFEDIEPGALQPANLWEAMCERRFPSSAGGGGAGVGGGAAGTGGSGG
ncbi:MAG: hypothetical protein JRI23_01410, partial [Deltaproteobacteria bacterium]|nr:hypothetical protein [Deltaproteobacteria bacterium]MBW2530119.1 hypothetical protein [Deltaproteobacteria bacterium]